jgi:hypothetical protein
LDDATILAQLAAFMESTYRAKAKLTAIIYLHPIVNDRLEGSALDNLSMFRKLCGPNCYPNIILATSFWSLVKPDIGLKRETELKEKEDFWGGMIQRGSQMIRLPDDRQRCIELLLKVSKKDKVVLQIQSELVDQKLDLSKTQAGASAKDTSALEALQADFTERLAKLAADGKRALEKQRLQYEKQRAQIDAENERKFREQKEESDRVIREHQKALKQAEELGRKMIEERETFEKQSALHMKEVTAKLERLEMQNRKARELEEKEKAKAASEKKFDALLAKIRSQYKLIETAKEAGVLKVTIDLTHLRLLRTCRICLHPASVQLSYSKSWMRFELEFDT